MKMAKIETVAIIFHENLIIYRQFTNDKCELNILLIWLVWAKKQTKRRRSRVRNEWRKRKMIDTVIAECCKMESFYFRFDIDEVYRSVSARIYTLHNASKYHFLVCDLGQIATQIVWHFRISNCDFHILPHHFKTILRPLCLAKKNRICLTKHSN